MASPTTLAPATLAPATLAPATLAPATMAPTTLAPTTMAPTSLPTAGGISHPTDEMLMWGGLTYGGSALALMLVYMVLASISRREGPLKRWLSPRGSVKWRQTLARDCLCNLYVREAEFVAQCGMDAYMSLRGIRFQAVAMFLVSITVSATLLPLYYMQEQPEKCVNYCAGVKRNESAASLDSFSSMQKSDDDAFRSECVCSGADKLSMASIAPGSPLLWCPVAGLAVSTLVLVLLLRREYREVVRVRAAYWLSQPPEMFTVLCDDIPTHLDLHTTEGLRRHFSGVFPEQILRIDPVRFNDESLLNQMRDVAKRRMACYDRITRLMALRDRYGRVPRCHALCLNMCCGSGSGDVSYSISKLEEKYEGLNRNFEELFYAYKKLEEDEAAGKLARPIRSCFITFSSATAATVSAQAVLDHRYSVVAVQASEPDDIIWQSLGYGATRRSCSKYAARLGFFVLVIFWGAFAASVGALTSLDAIERQVPKLREFLEANPAVESIVEQLAPLVLSSLLAIVNPLICFLARIEARASEADADQLATTWYFVFLVIQVFIFYGVSGPIFNSIDVSRPSEIVSTLASRIPRNASFYMLFFVSKFLTFLCMDMYRVADVILDLLRRCLLGAALSHRDRRNARCGCHVLSFPAHRNLSALNGQMLLLFFIAASYVVIQPLIAPVAFVFFFIAYFVYARIFMAVNMQRFDAGGTLWTRSYYCYVSAILVAQLTLIGLLSLREGYAQSSAVVLMFFTTAFVAAMVDFRYRPLVTALPLDLAARIDQKIDDSEPAAMLAASVWQYGMLTGEDPNYLGRRIKGNFNFDTPFHPNAIAVSAPAGGHHHNSSGGNLDDTFDTGDDEDDDDEMNDPILASYRNAGNDRLQQHQDQQQNQQNRSSPPTARVSTPGHTGAFEFFSYELPVLREPPILDLPESATQDSSRDVRRANYDASASTTPLLREP